jgi:hypothetical protein
VVDQIVDAGYAMAWSVQVCVYHDNGQSLWLINKPLMLSVPSIIVPSIMAFLLHR